MDFSYFETTITMIWVATSVSCAWSECTPLNLTLYESFSNVTSNETVMWEKTFVDRVSCVVTCVEDAKCVSFQYHSDQLLCKAYPFGSGVLKNLAGAEVEGYHTFMLPERESGTWRSACSVNSDCAVANTECNDNKCQCKIGYSFNPKTSQCVAGCTTYGNSFTTHAYYVIYSYDDSNANGDSIEKCTELCSAIEGCKSVEFLGYMKKCFFQNIVWFDVPVQSRAQNELDWIYAQRNCKD